MSAAVAQLSTRPHRSDLEVFVSDSQKRGEGVSSYVTYCVLARGSLVAEWGAGGEETGVWRRYSDFEWLKNALKHAFPCTLVPPLPDKQVIGRFNEDFIEIRRRGLQRFLDRCVEHEVLRESEYFHKFLILGDPQFGQYKESVNSARSKGKSKFFGMMSAAAKSVAKRVGNQAYVSQTPEDLSFSELENHISGLKPVLKGLREQSSTMLDKEGELSRLCTEFGESYRRLSSSEGDALGEALYLVGNASERVAQFKALLSEGSLKWFVEDIADAERLVHSACELFETRHASKQEYGDAMKNLEQKKTYLQKVQGGEQAEQAQRDVNTAEEAAQECKKKLSETSKAVLGEIERFRKMHVQDFERLILDFSIANAEVDEAIATVWESVATDVKRAAQREISNANKMPPSVEESGSAEGSAEVS
eukprot:gb/GECG01010722.1/.p1 GENE.gb/GECG01010722.1/~~gb/GECG01010722.1/.p1  ORF type:complete len:420 (+),score=60.19 gb/GECG01010722.1/:1-1260(+)